MKIRNGFISNSSSTCFILMLKDNDLDYIESVLRNNKKAFENIDLHNEDIIDSLIDNIEATCYFYDPDFIISVENRNVNNLKDSVHGPLGLEIIVEKSRFISYLKEAKKYGLNNVTMVSYGVMGNEMDTETSDVMEESLVEYKNYDLFIYSNFNEYLGVY